LFRVLLYRGLPADPPADTPVKMFSDCFELENIYSPIGVCAEMPSW
jgi:hypothetical protein